ncbi:hypothetical protein INS49_003862 [Diaporthe citri]|uniref:uncharacterized protein n=1 Tax=Diaporthe citri TaxID=83186 RepID=UPI001C7E385A|nr:uncharacterized protein INS49_003862 [Diaporthe citri]KAG6354781.1 hypothetical protein INS49_003862 [Diaporthe citri]
MAETPQAKLQALSEEFTKLQTEMQTVVSSRQKLEAQRQENSGVKSEFGKLKDDEAIYKLVGPALLKQDKVEAESTVDGRLEFINKEITRQESQIKETQEKVERVKGDIIRIQTAAQSAAQGKAPAAAGAGAAKA